MIIRKFTSPITSLVSAGVILTSAISPVFAQSTIPGKNKTANQGQRITTLKSRGDTEIEKRTTSLNTGISKVQAAKKLTVAQKSSLIANDQTLQGNLNTLKAKIDADTDLATLKNDVMSITRDYRVYLLVLPQTAIIRASDRIQDVVLDMNALAVKLEIRITQAQQAGHDVTTLNTSLSDMKTKVTDAQRQAQNAMNTVANLTPDKGDQGQLAANSKAIQTARSEMKAAELDLKTARLDARSIVTALKTMK